MGTGTAALEFFGNHDGTLVNSPAWATDGITFSAANQSITYANGFDVDFASGGLSVFAFYSGMGSSLSVGEGGMNFLTGGQFSCYITTGVGGGNTWYEQTKNVNGNRYFTTLNGAQSTSGDRSYIWNASLLQGYRDGSLRETANLPTSSAASASITLSTTAKPTGNSRISAIFVFPASIPLRDEDVTELYALYRNTIGQGLSLAF